MTDFLSFLNSTNFPSSMNMLTILLIINIFLSSMLIIQNIRTRKVYKKLNKTDGANQKSYSGKKIPPPPTENSLNWHTMSKLDVEQSKLNRVIKMVKENRSREEIKKAIDMEDDYLSILMQNYK